MAAIAPKTISSQMDAEPRNELRITQILREQIARLTNFTVFSTSLYYALIIGTAALARDEYTLGEYLDIHIT
jgi:hypothetical protein